MSQKSSRRALSEDGSGPVEGCRRGAEGNTERLAFVFDSYRVQPTGLAGELVIPPLEGGRVCSPVRADAFRGSFTSGDAEFVLVTLHVLYGDVPPEREPELREIASWMADWGADPERYHDDLIVLGDFNIDRVGDPRFDAFTSSGLFVPDAIRGQRSTIFDTNAKHYDQIAWFQGEMEMSFTGRGGSLDFANAVFRELTNLEKSYRVSDHIPLWLEFGMALLLSSCSVLAACGPETPGPDLGDHNEQAADEVTVVVGPSGRISELPGIATGDSHLGSELRARAV